MVRTDLALPAGVAVPALVVAAGDRAGIRFVEFFASAIRNPHTRRAYARAAGDFLAWCAGTSVTSITEVQPLHVAAWIELQTQTLSAPSVKQHLAAIRHLFDWLVIGQIVPHNPAASVRGPSHTAKKGKTPVLDATEARQLLDSIDVTTPAGLRDRALIALMVFSFARVSSRARLLLKTRPKRGALVRYGDRIAEVLGEVRGERVMIRSLHADGVERRSAVKWKNLKLLDDQLF